MINPKSLPEKHTSKVEETNPKKGSPAAPVIETPVPPQVMDPSATPEIEKRIPATQPGKRKRNNLVQYVKLEY